MNITSTGALDKWLEDLSRQGSERYELEAGFFDSEQAGIAAQNEYGGSQATTQEFRDQLTGKEGAKNPKNWNVIPRPFMLKATEDAIQWSKTVLKELQADIDLHSSLEKVGEQMVDSIHASINSGEWEENNPMWSEAKGGLPPLINTGKMASSVEWKIS